MITLSHGFYSCDTGCCGTVFQDEDSDLYHFIFEHPDRCEPIDFVRHVLNVRYSYEKYLLSQREELGVKFIDDPDKWC